MNAFQMTTDKVLLTVFVTVLVGFLTAAMSIVRLVNDKESKTTDYRQAWTDSLRKCFAALISNINTLASLTATRMASADGISELIGIELDSKESAANKAIVEKTRAYLDKRILEEDKHIRDVRQSMHESYALTRLHFKPNDLSFSRVEQKFDVIVELFEKLYSLSKKEQEGERKVLRERIRSESNELTAFSRDILKTEWEAVKRGESAYQRTKFWSIVGGAVALFGLAIFGLATAWSFLRSEPPSVHQSNSGTLGIRPVVFSTSSANSGLEVQRISTTEPSTAQTVNVFGANAACPTPKRQFNPPKPQTSVSCPP